MANQTHLHFHPGALSDLNYSKLHPVVFKFLKSKKKDVIVIEV